MTATQSLSNPGGIAIDMNPTDSTSVLTNASPGIRDRHHYHHPDEGEVYHCDNPIQKSRRVASFPTNGPSSASKAPMSQTTTTGSMTTSHHHSPPAFVSHGRQLPETSPNSANAARALSSLFHHCPPEYHRRQQSHHQPNQHHHAPYSPHGPDPSSSWGDPPPPRYTYPGASQHHQHSSTWHRQSPYPSATKTTPHTAPTFHNPNHQSSSPPSISTSSTGSFEVSLFALKLETYVNQSYNPLSVVSARLSSPHHC